MKELIGPIYARKDYAGFIRRTIALAIDFLILYGLWHAAGEILLRFAPERWFTEDGYLNDEATALYYFWPWPAAILYMLAFRLTAGGTIGYRIVGIRYAYALGGRPPFYLILYRALVAVFLLLFFALDHIWIAFDERKQAWHDKASGFYVVKRRAQPIGTARVKRRYIQFMMLTFPVWEPENEIRSTLESA
ncbi:MAG TPA: RDD family protein [Phycisphaerae bacterium]|nr:RDD family protein [Phycisphaerae bacterium]